MIAFDTNILVYAETIEDSRNRHVQARRLLADAIETGGIICLQVFGELANVCRRKTILEPIELAVRLAGYEAMFTTPPTQSADIADAALISHRFGIQYFDALILTVSRRAGATLLISEDMADGIEIEGVRIVNPFVPANAPMLADYYAANS